MTKIYAVVQPSYSSDGENMLGVFVDPAVWLFHRYNYEQVCGYSLGRPVLFFETLDEAKYWIRTDMVDGRVPNGYRGHDGAIVELEKNAGGQITGFYQLFELNGFEKRYKKIHPDDDYAKEVEVPTWNERAINAADLTAGSLLELNRQHALIKPAVVAQASREPQPSSTDSKILRALAKMDESQKVRFMELIAASQQEAQTPSPALASVAKGKRNRAKNPAHQPDHQAPKPRY